MSFVRYALGIWQLIVLLFCSRSELILEIIALRHQITMLKRGKPKPKIKNRDRLFWIVISKLWKDWSRVLLIVQPETILKWHRQGFKLFWRLKSHKKAGRPKIEPEIRRLIRQLSKENPT